MHLKVRLFTLELLQDAFVFVRINQRKTIKEVPFHYLGDCF